MAGSVRKKGNRWYYSFEASSVDGKRKRIERAGGRTKKEAEKALRQALLEYENAGSIFEPSEISMSDYMDYWLKNYVEVNCKYNTVSAYTQIVNNHVKPVLGIYKLKSLTPTMLQEYINEKYLTGISKNHLTNITTVLRGAIRYAVHPCKFIKENPMQYVKLPKYDQAKTEDNLKIISKSDFDKISTRFPHGSSFYMALMIGYHTGCRISEAMALTWKDIDLENGTLDINKILIKKQKSWYFSTPKTRGSIRTIHIGKTLLTALKKQQTWQKENRLKYGQYFTKQYEVKEPDGNQKQRRIYSLESSIETAFNEILMVCTKENGEMITPDSFKYAARVIHYELGLDFNYHALRHTHATTLIENGANIKDVQTRLGHSNIETTLDTYTHTTENMSKQTVDIFENAVSKK